MLYITRKIGQTVVINGNIKIELVEINGSNVKLGIECPVSVSVLREEIYNKIADSNKEAIASVKDLLIKDF
jgi:carbon storage regulator